jgi:tetratricopeptide (TPR) repeat protein
MPGKKEKPTKNRKKFEITASKEIHRKYFYYFIIAFTFLLYANSIRNDYSFDDGYVVNVNAKKESDQRSISDILKQNYIHGVESGEEVNFGYRPVVQVTFALDRLFAGNTPHFSHFINVMLFVCIAVLLFLVLTSVFKAYSIWVPFLIVLLYVAHPVNTEVVCSLKNRDVLLSFFFSLTSLHMFMLFADDKVWWKFVLAFSFFGIALYSKISTLTFIVIIPMTIYYFKQIKFYRVIVIFLLLLSFSLLLNYLPKLYLDPSYRPKFFYENPLYFNTDGWLRISTALYILIYYLKLVIFPHPLLFYYGYEKINIVGWTNIWVWISLALHLALLIYALKNLKKGNISSYGILFYLITISMFINLIRPPAGMVADRFLFRPVLGFCILLVVFVLKNFKIPFHDNTLRLDLYKRRAILPFVVILLLYSFKTISRTNNWKDTMTLVKHDMPYLENSAKANYIYAGLLRQEAYEKINKTGNFQKYVPLIYQNIDHLNQAIKVYPGYYDAYDKLAESYYFYLNDPGKAIEYLRTSIRINPEFAIAYYNTGFIFRNQKQYDSALLYINKAIQLQPNNRPFYKYLADIYYEKGDSLKGDEVMLKAKSIKKGNGNKKKRRKNRDDS